MELLLREVLSVPSYTYSEDRMRDFILNHAQEKGYRVMEDGTGNVYLTKGDLLEGEYYPCVVAHMDTVHRDQEILVKENIKKNLYDEQVNGLTHLKAMHPLTNSQTGVGGDNGAGLYIALELMSRFEKIKGAFFIAEEIGMMGSKMANDEFFKNVGYAIQYDAPSDNWFSVSCMGLRLWTPEFLKEVKPVLDKYHINNFSHDPFTDVVQLRSKYDFCCAVLPSGYYNWHRPTEYVIIEHVLQGVRLGVDFIASLGNKKYFMEPKLR